MSDDEDYEDYEDDMIYLEAAPVTKYTFYHFFFTLTIGILRTLIECFANLGNAVTGAEVYDSNKKAFEDEARLELEMIWNSPEEGEQEV